jgi:hypothetical protein
MSGPRPRYWLVAALICLFVLGGVLPHSHTDAAGRHSHHDCAACRGSHLLSSALPTAPATVAFVLALSGHTVADAEATPLGRAALCLPSRAPPLA